MFINSTFYIKNSLCFQTMPSDPKVLLGIVFSSPVTEGYAPHMFGSHLVASVNGKQISNIRDLVIAMETNTDSHLCIETTNKEKLILAITTPQEETEILLTYGITKTHSDDLLPIIQMARAAQSGSTSLVSHQFITQNPPPVNEVKKEVDRRHDTKFVPKT